jgi:hypothetical protein
VNADLIAAGLSALAPALQQTAAGRLIGRSRVLHHEGFLQHRLSDSRS